MRGERRAADTIELELSAEQLRALSEGLAAEGEEEKTEALAPEEVARPKRKTYPWHWASLVVAAAAISGISSGVTYLAVKHAEPTLAYEAPPSASPAAPDPQPAQTVEALVHFANPFDKTEIFQFPAGTSEKSAREAVAELLVKRARERLAAADHFDAPFSRNNDDAHSATAVAQRSW
jgi:hypothetical protein